MNVHVEEYMKKIANRLTIALASLAILFAGCSNGVDGSVDSFKYSVLTAAMNNGSSRLTTKTLNVSAITEDKYIDFSGSGSRTITPDQIDAGDLKFYMWGLDDSNNKKVPVAEVKFTTGASKFEGKVPVQLDVSDYKLYLAAVPATVASGLSIAGNESGYATDVAAVRAAAILYANANVDLRYNQNVKFYLSPFHLEGASGAINLTLKTYDFNDAGIKDYWHKDGYYVAISFQNLSDGTVVNVAPTATGTGSYVVANSNDKLAVNTVAVAVGTGSFNVSGSTLTVPSNITSWGALETAGGLTYTLSAVPSGEYNLVVKFVGPEKSYFYTEKVIVLSNRDITSTVEIPNIIGKKPKAVSNLKVGYNDPDNSDCEYYLATFQWDDNSNNEEYFVLQLVDVSADVATWRQDGTVLGLTTDAKTALTEVAAAPIAIVSADYATDFADVKTAWNAEVTSAKLTSEAVTGMSLDPSFYQDPNGPWAAGNLGKNCTTVSVWLPLGSVYMARICAYNQECESLGTTDAAILTSDQEWLYANKGSLESAATGTVDTLPVIYLAVDSSTGYVSDSYTPSMWPKSIASPTTETEDTPVAINRYRLTYNLNQGHFWKLHDENGRLESVYQNETAGASNTPFQSPDTDVTGSVPKITGISGTYSKIVEYHTVTATGTEIISPIAYEYDSTNNYYATLYNGNNVWTGWKKDDINGTEMEDGTHIFRDIKWTPVVETSGTTLTNPEAVQESSRTYEITSTTFASATVAADPSYYIASAYGYIRTAGCGSDTKSPLTASSTFGDVATKSTARSIVIRSSLPNYVTFKNLNLYAQYTATFASVLIYSPANYDLTTANIRVQKSSDGSTYETANVYGTPEAPVTGTYTDYELDGTEFLISTFYNKLRIRVLDFKNIYKLAKVEILQNGASSTGDHYNKVDSAKFTLDAALVGSGTGDKDPLTVAPLSLSESDQFIFDIDIIPLTPGKYTAKIYAYSTTNEKTAFEYPLTFEIADPSYTAYTACTAGDTHTELFETTDAADVSKYYRSTYSSYDDATANGVTVYYGSASAY